MPDADKLFAVLERIADALESLDRKTAWDSGTQCPGCEEAERLSWEATRRKK